MDDNALRADPAGGVVLCATLSAMRTRPAWAPDAATALDADQAGVLMRLSSDGRILGARTPGRSAGAKAAAIAFGPTGDLHAAGFYTGDGKIGTEQVKKRGAATAFLRSSAGD